MATNAKISVQTALEIVVVMLRQESAHKAAQTAGMESFVIDVSTGDYVVISFLSYLVQTCGKKFLYLRFKLQTLLKILSLVRGLE